jgi:hypothetical protein
MTVRQKAQQRRLIVTSTAVLAVSVLSSGCSAAQMVARGTIPIVHGGVQAMSHEPDVQLAQAAMPANLEFIEGLIYEDPRNPELRAYAAQAFYGYAFYFVEDVDRERASNLYKRCFGQAAEGLKHLGLDINVLTVDEHELETRLSRLGQPAVPNLAWGASCLSKYIDLNRDDPAKVADLPRAAALMTRVLQLDEGYFHALPDLFFGVYYASRPPILGGDYAKAEQYFGKARSFSGGDNFLVDVLQAQYLERQKQDRKAFHSLLTRVVNGDAEKKPDLTLQNRVSQQKAKALLAKEAEWF